MQHMDDALSSWQNERLESRVVWCFLRSGWADGETKDHFVQLTIFRCGHSRDDHAALFHGAFEPPVTCKVLQQGRRQMCKLPQIDQRHFQSNKENIFLQPVSGGKRVSFQDLERKHKEGYEIGSGSETERPSDASGSGTPPADYDLHLSD
eukprot:s1995_g1.t3